MAKVHPLLNMNANMGEVTQLLEIRERLTGLERGRRYDVEVLHKSAIVLITACWEALVEDLAADGFDFLLDMAEQPDVFPPKVRTLASKGIREAKDESRVWDLAGDGWKQILIDHRQRTIDRSVGSLNSPRAENVDRMFREILGINNVSSSWSWGRLNAGRAREKLDGFVTLRGSIAHRVSTAGSVTKANVTDYRKFAFRISVKTANRVNCHIGKLVGKRPWTTWSFGRVR